MFEQKCQGAVDVISGGDRISGEHVAELATVLEARLERGQPHVVLDLQGVAIIDSRSNCCSIAREIPAHRRVKLARARCAARC
jgi:hypothetical protein